MDIQLYRLSYEDGEYCVGTEAEVISRHNEWVEASGRFEPYEVKEALATTIDDLKEHWTVEQFYTVQIKVVEDKEVV